VSSYEGEFTLTLNGRFLTQDFGAVLNKVSIYTCPTSEVRVIVSNGIPDHGITLDNPNQPCELNWMISLPLSPTLTTTLTEPAALGIIGMIGIRYHSGEFGLFEEISSVPSTQLLGYAMVDGFPIYGHLADQSVLDGCNGVGDTSATFRYHVRTKDYFR
jgi:hypothetical protein